MHTHTHIVHTTYTKTPFFVVIDMPEDIIVIVVEGLNGWVDTTAHATHRVSQSL